MIRSSNVEILRIVLMTMIVLWHFIVHGMGLSSGDDILLSNLSMEHLYVLSILSYHVNCFVFISGYFGIQLKRKKVLSFVEMTFFYSILSFLLLLILKNGFYFYRYIHWNSLIYLLPISSNAWWFITNYFFFNAYSTHC